MRAVSCCLALLLLSAACPWTAVARSHVLAWDHAGQASTFAIDQCRVAQQRCTMAHVVSVPGTTRSIEFASLQATGRYCWEVRLSSGQRSNRVCTP